MNSKSKNELEMPDIIQNMEIKSGKEISCDTIKKWAKKCPNCGIEQVYISKKSFQRSSRKNSSCQKCNSCINGKRGKTSDFIGRWKKRCPECGKELIYSYFIEQWGKENGYNFQHALNGGEVELYGYFVDGYDKEKNIIFEYDEKHHYSGGSLCKEDEIKQNVIVEKINPTRFVRYNEREKKLYNVVNKEVICQPL